MDRRINRNENTKNNIPQKEHNWYNNDRVKGYSLISQCIVKPMSLYTPTCSPVTS